MCASVIGDPALPIVAEFEIVTVPPTCSVPPLTWDEFCRHRLPRT
jgi:hypothetical protein